MATIDSHKTRLIKRILEIPNENVLDSIDNLLDSFSVDAIITTNEIQKKAIFQGIKDIEEGNYYSQEEIDKMDLEWLNGK